MWTATTAILSFANNWHRGAAARRVTLRLQHAGFFNGCGEVLPPVTRTRPPRKKEKRIGFRRGRKIDPHQFCEAAFLPLTKRRGVLSATRGVPGRSAVVTS